jgi:tripartite-type tricarboxylate transporter receptor subunit TctC
VDQVAAALARVLAQEGVRQRLTGAGMDPVATSGPDEFKEWTEGEMQRWQAVVRKAGISMQ